MIYRRIVPPPPGLFSWPIQLVHHYRVLGECAAHVSLRGTFMADLRYFTARASTDAKWAAKRNRTSGTGSPTTLYSLVPLPRSIRQRGSDDESPACKAPVAVSPVMTGGSAQAATSTIVLAESYSAPTVPKLCSVPYGGQWPSVPVPKFPVRSSSVATQQYPSSPGSRVSTVCMNLDELHSDCSRSMNIIFSVSFVIVDQGV